MAVTRTRAALAVQHDTLGAAHVTAVLGLEPTDAFEPGEAYARDSMTRSHSHWSLESPSAEPALEPQLRALLGVLAPHREALSALAQEGYRLTWTCFVEEDCGDGAVSLSAGLLAELGSMPVDLWVDSYADTAQD
ncbi:MAG: DUF4279 domain-containing protein [Frankiales bacterium]|nr:DUF4279 domain-containing protein [Frankiales bacterium]